MSHTSERASPPYVVLESDAGEPKDLVEQLQSDGWRISSGWNAPAPAGRTVCVGRVATAADAAAALLAAVAGAGVVVIATAEREIVDRLCDDLRRFGPLDHRFASKDNAPSLGADERALLELLLSGQTLGRAATALGLSRRTADRRLAVARQHLGVQTTAEALAAYASAGRRR